MNISPDTTVGELAARHPATVNVFQHDQVEFCCGGQCTLARTAEAIGIPFSVLAGESTTRSPMH
jgi:iron-sulfur cluster repair protein YtfE (RIC family)